MLSWRKDIPKDILTYGQGEKKQPINAKKENVRNITATEWCLERLVRMQHEYGHHYPELLQFAQIVLSAPITNAWPEHGASAIKRIKTRLRNRLKNDMLNSLLQISINGPELNSMEADDFVKQAASRWLNERNRRKVLRRGSKGELH